MSLLPFACSFKVCVQEFDDASASTKCATVRGKTYFEEIMDQASFEEPSLNSDYGSKFFKYDLGGSYNLYIGEVQIFSTILPKDACLVPNGGN